jgi:protein tyrosine phosphatase
MTMYRKQRSSDQFRCCMLHNTLQRSKLLLHQQPHHSNGCHNKDVPKRRDHLVTEKSLLLVHCIAYCCRTKTPVGLLDRILAVITAVLLGTEVLPQH